MLIKEIRVNWNKGTNMWIFVLNSQIPLNLHKSELGTALSHHNDNSLFLWLLYFCGKVSWVIINMSECKTSIRVDHSWQRPREFFFFFFDQYKVCSPDFLNEICVVRIALLAAERSMSRWSRLWTQNWYFFLNQVSSIFYTFNTNLLFTMQHH